MFCSSQCTSLALRAHQPLALGSRTRASAQGAAHPVSHRPQAGQERREASPGPPMCSRSITRW
jgi:hypothetical protein